MNSSKNTSNNPEELIQQILESVLLQALKPVMTKLNTLQQELSTYGDVLEALVERVENLEKINHSLNDSSNQGLMKINNILGSQFQSINTLREIVSSALRMSPTGTLRDNLSKLINVSEQQTRKQSELSRALETTMQISQQQMKQQYRLSQTVEQLVQVLEIKQTLDKQQPTQTTNSNQP